MDQNSETKGAKIWGCNARSGQLQMTLVICQIAEKKKCNWPCLWPYIAGQKRSWVRSLPVHWLFNGASSFPCQNLRQHLPTIQLPNFKLASVYCWFKWASSFPCRKQDPSNHHSDTTPPHLLHDMIDQTNWSLHHYLLVLVKRKQAT